MSSTDRAQFLETATRLGARVAHAIQARDLVPQDAFEEFKHKAVVEMVSAFSSAFTLLTFLQIALVKHYSSNPNWGPKISIPLLAIAAFEEVKRASKSTDARNRTVRLASVTEDRDGLAESSLYNSRYTGDISKIALGGDRWWLEGTYSPITNSFLLISRLARFLPQPKKRTARKSASRPAREEAASVSDCLL